MLHSLPQSSTTPTLSPQCRHSVQTLQDQCMRAAQAGRAHATFACMPQLHAVHWANARYHAPFSGAFFSTCFELLSRQAFGNAALSMLHKPMNDCCAPFTGLPQRHKLFECRSCQVVCRAQHAGHAAHCSCASASRCVRGCLCAANCACWHRREFAQLRLSAQGNIRQAVAINREQQNIAVTPTCISVCDSMMWAMRLCCTVPRLAAPAASDEAWTARNGTQWRSQPEAIELDV